MTWIAIVGREATLGKNRAACRCSTQGQAEAWANLHREEGEFAAVVQLDEAGKQIERVDL